MLFWSHPGQELCFWTSSGFAQYGPSGSGRAHAEPCCCVGFCGFELQDGAFCHGIWPELFSIPESFLFFYLEYPHCLTLFLSSKKP